MKFPKGLFARAERRRTFEIAERFAGFSMCMSSLEALIDHKELSAEGIRRPSPLHGRDPNKPVAERLLFRALDRKWALVGLHSMRVFAGAVLTLAPDNGHRRVAVVRGSLAGFLAASEGWLALYNRYGSDGADQAAIQALAPAAIGRLSRNETVQDAAIWYTGLQGVLSYAVAGVAKLFGPEWRQGTAIEGILRTNAYGHEGLWRFFKSHPTLAKLATWGTVAWEISYPLALLPYPWLTRSYSASAMIFHVANAHFMGLGRFAWAFASLHPAINQIAAPKTIGIPTLNADLPKAAGVAVLAGSAALGLSAVLRNINVRSLPIGWSRKSTRNGNSLAVRMRKGQGDRLIIFEAGLGAPIEIYQWYIDALCQYSDHSILCYERAGYGASRLNRRLEKNWSLDLAVDDLQDLIVEFRGQRQEVVIIGHSMGGELIRRLSNRDPDLLSQIVLVDSTNINQFTDGSLSDDDKFNLLKSFRIQRNKTIVGLGGVMNQTPPSKDLPSFVRTRAVASERNHRMWSAAAREYESLLEGLPMEPVVLFENAVQRQVFSAQTTMDLSTTRGLQEQLAGQPQSEPTDTTKTNFNGVITVPGKHDTMFMTPTYGVKLAIKTLASIEVGK